MRLLKIVQANAVAYAVLICMLCFVAAYQMRISLDTVHVERNLDFYVPLLLTPFTDRIHSGEHRGGSDAKYTLRRGDELVRVNGRAFRGLSVYLQELSKAQHRPWIVWHPIIVTIRSHDFHMHDVELGIPHCTCGVPSAFEAAGIWIVPPMYCILLGFLTAFIRPRSILAWTFLGAMLSLSQLQFWPESYTGFQQIATPMTWADWFRVPAVGYQSFVQHAWPATVLVALACFYQTRRSVYRLAMGVAAWFLVFAALDAMLEIAWSEDFRKLVALYGFLEHNMAGLMTALLAGVAGVAWFLDRRLGVVVVAIGLLAAVARYWSPAFINDGHWYTYPDNTTRFVGTVPVIHNTPGFVTLLFAAGCILAALVFFRREITRREVASLILCMPLVVSIAGTLGEYWYPLGPQLFEYWPWFVLTSAGVGLAGIAWSVLQRTMPKSASPAPGEHA